MLSMISFERMERTQISLEKEQADLLRRLARARGVSMAHLIRDAVDLAYGSAVAPPPRDELWKRALSTIGSGSGDGAPVSEEHDRYLDESYDP
jgi:Ribbon-helix-helix protein, copG family